MQGIPQRLCYEIKTLLVSAQIEFTLDSSTETPQGLLKAQLKVPLKGRIDFEAKSQFEKMAITNQTTVYFRTFAESGVMGLRGNEWVASTEEGLRVNGEALSSAPCLQTLVSIVQAPYLFWQAPTNVETFFMGFLVGTKQQAIRFQKMESKDPLTKYEVRALPLSEREENVEALHWARGYPAHIQIKDGILDSVEVTVPVAGRLTMKRVS
jgi:hypothetical protein